MSQSKNTCRSKYHKLINILGPETASIVNIPTNDPTAWSNYPNYRWIYNRITLCEFQGVDHAPMPIDPPSYPVIIKPYTNLYGMGLNIIKINNREEFQEQWHNTNFWMEFFEGDHHSYDLVILQGEIQFYTCFIGYKDPIKLGKFDYWESVERDIPDIINKLVGEHMQDYTGCLNVETIDDKIIEAHLRMGDIDQFPTTKVLEGIIATYLGEKYDWNFTLDKIFFIPVWSKGESSDEIKDYLEEEIAPLMERNNHVHSYNIDSPTLASPCDDKRLMWFTCGNIEVGKMIREKIYEKIDIINV